MRCSIFLIAITCLSSLGWAQDPAAKEWIWSHKVAKANEVTYFRTEFTLAQVPEKAQIRFTCDNGATVVINGKPVGETNDWNEPVVAADKGFLQAGKNWVAVKATNDAGNIAAFVMDIGAPKAPPVLVTNGQWKFSPTGQGWDQPNTDTTSWQPVASMGKYGSGPWGQALDGGKKGGLAEDTITAPAGFKVDLIYTVPKSNQGSWVCLAVDHKGRFLAGDQDGKIYRITLTKSEPKVEELAVKLTHAQGLLYANNALYVVVNGPNPGLYRLRDTNGDDQFDEETLLRKIDGGGEHGPHQVVLAPDGKSLYVTGGNHTKIPNPERSLVSPMYGEDHLLPRDWDANGHAKGILAPGGWICQTDFEGKTWTLFAAGFRNEYDVAFSPTGEAFTYDADMEWDIGMPWYRPTRINHAIAGNESGWRSGTGKWPAYYIDSLPAAVNIGPGSPTGVVFGTGAKFPAKYQRACFALDWTYGTMYAIHLTPNGASFDGEKESFITGKPLPLTDAVIHPDGAMYFTVGGRKTQSALFRVTYTGPESTAPVGPATMTKEAKLRHELEALILAPPQQRSAG